MEKVMICGDIEWYDVQYICKILKTLNKNCTIVQGKMKGVEFIANFYGHLLGYKIKCNTNYNLKNYATLDYSDRLYLLYIEENPTKILIVDNKFESNKAYDFIEDIKDKVEIIVIKSIMNT